jgi:MFS family permease
LAALLLDEAAFGGIIGLFTMAPYKGGIGPREIEITILFSCFIAANYAFGIFLFATLAPEMTKALGLGYDAVGFASGLAQVALALAGLLSGIITPMIGTKRMILLPTLVSAVCLIVLSTTRNSTLVVILLTFLGACAGCMWVPMVAAARAEISPDHLGKALGLMSSGTAYGFMLNGLIVPPLLARWGWQSVWLVAGSLTLALVAVGAIRLGPPTARAPERAAMDSRAQSIRGGLSRRGVQVVALWLVSGATLVPYQMYLSSMLQDAYGWPSDLAARTWSAIGVGGMLGGFLFGSIADRFSIKWTLVLTYLLLLLANIAVAATDWVNAVYAGVILFGLAYYAVFGLLSAYIAKESDASGAARLSALSFVALGFGSTAGNYFGGLLLEYTRSFTALYGSLAIGISVAIAGSLLLPLDRTVSGHRLATRPASQ